MMLELPERRKAALTAFGLPDRNNFSLSAKHLFCWYVPTVTIGQKKGQYGTWCSAWNLVFIFCLANNGLSENQSALAACGLAASSRHFGCSTAPKSRPSTASIRESSGVHESSDCDQNGADVRSSIPRTDGKWSCGRRVLHGQGPRVSGTICERQRRRCGQGLGFDNSRGDLEHPSP